MWKKDLEKLELDIAREKDREVADRLKAVLEARQQERRERNLRLKRQWDRTLINILIIMVGILALGALVALIAWFFGVR
jgi:hypothetical protein